MNPSELQKGDVVLAYFPYADGPGGKERPAVVLGIHPEKGLVYLAPITSQNVAMIAPEDYEVPLCEGQARAVGLRMRSRVDASKCRVLRLDAVRRRFGTIRAIPHGMDRVIAAVAAWSRRQAQKEGRIPGR